MLTKSVFVLGSFTLAALSMLMPQGQTLDPQDFTDCALDIRPDNRVEVQVYWREAPTGTTGMVMELWAPVDGVVTIGFPDGKNTPIDVVRGKANLATFLYTEGTNEVTLELNNGTPGGRQLIPTVGTYNAMIPMVSPIKTRLRPPALNQERILITGKNFGLEFSFTLTRTLT